jgi:hypothetical protein
MCHAVAIVEESFFERRYLGDQAGPGLIARVVTQYDEVRCTRGRTSSRPSLK